MKFFKKLSAGIVSIALGIGAGIVAAVLSPVSIPVAIAIGIGVSIVGSAITTGLAASIYSIGKEDGENNNKSTSKFREIVRSEVQVSRDDTQLKHEELKEAVRQTNIAINSHNERSETNHKTTHSMLRSSEKVSDSLANIGMYASTDQKSSELRSPSNDDGVTEPVRKPLRA